MDRRSALTTMALGAAAATLGTGPASADMVSLIEAHRQLAEREVALAEEMNRAEDDARKEYAANPVMAPVSLSPISTRQGAVYRELSPIFGSESDEEIRDHIARYHDQEMTAPIEIVRALEGDDRAEALRQRIEAAKQAALARLDEARAELDARPAVKRYNDIRAAWSEVCDQADDALLRLMFCPATPDEARMRADYLIKVPDLEGKIDTCRVAEIAKEFCGIA